jgi:Ca-activated chloride channel family protein
VGDKRQTFDFPATLVQRSEDGSFAFVEKVWAIRRVGEILDQLDLKGQNEELVRELVELATRHGILTPYTSFLADERTNLYDVGVNSRRAGGRLSALNDTEGESGFGQRVMKGSLQQANQADGREKFYADNATKAAGAMAASPCAGRGYGSGMGGGYGSTTTTNNQTRSGLFPAEDSRSAQRELSQAGQNLRQVGNRNFYRRNNRWVDSQVTEKQAAHAQRITQFSDEYFKLAEAHGRELSQYLAFDEPVLLNVENQTYLIEPPAAPAEVLVFEGTVSSLENRPTANSADATHSTNDWIVTVRIDHLVKGQFDGSTFRFRVHSPEQSGLSVGGKYTVEAQHARDGYTVDQDQWKRPADKK